MWQHIQPFSVPHNAVDPAGSTLIKNDVKIAIVTDLGTITGMIKEKIIQCNLIMVEANYDTNMLKNGPYPWYLKQRISNKTGQLSNKNTADLIRNIIHPNLDHVVIVHLSCKNDNAKTACECINSVLSGHSTNLHIASQISGSRVLKL